MLVTELQAKEMWCPAVRALCRITIKEHGIDVDQVPATANRDSRNAPLGNCIGSRCMWFRWWALETEFVSGDERPEGDGWVEGTMHSMATSAVSKAWSRTVGEKRGYCGMAGKPEGRT